MKSHKDKNMPEGFNKLVILLIVLVIGIVLLEMNLGIISGKAEKCSASKYNPSNVSGGRYFAGKCYVPVYHTYQTNEECGLFGISCYETSEPRTKMFTTEACFQLKTGELC